MNYNQMRSSPVFQQRASGSSSVALQGGLGCSHQHRRPATVRFQSPSLVPPSPLSLSSFQVRHLEHPSPCTKRSAPIRALAGIAPAVDRNTTGDAGEQGDVLIEFKNVSKSFGDKTILRGASFKIRRGEAVGIIGASGTGKSTTLRIAAGLLAPDSGEVLIMGKKRVGLLSDQQEVEKLCVGMVFQNAALFDSLTVGENVGFLLYEHSDLPEAQIKSMVADCLGKVGLRGVEDLYPAELSGGMKKRVALARAVVPDQREDTEQVIMYDEPTAGLDPVASTVVEDLMRSLHNNSSSKRNESSRSSSRSRNSRSASPSPPSSPSRDAAPRNGISSYIVVTHQHSTIRRAVDRIIFLHKGSVAWEGSVEEFDTTDEPIVRQFAEGTLDGPISYV